jgi:hypothetical protein
MQNVAASQVVLKTAVTLGPKLAAFGSLGGQSESKAAAFSFLRGRVIQKNNS